MQETGEWQSYCCTTMGRPWLSRGDLVRMHQTERGRLGGKLGVYIRPLRVNLLISVDGIEWRVHPSAIAKWCKGDPRNLLVNEATPSPKGVSVTKGSIRDECVVGDVVLMFRGKFDVVKIVSMNADVIRCQGLDGRARDKIYRYNAEWFVQKLDSERIVA